MSEPTRYTRCWHCNREFPLREIRAHGAWCRNREQSTTFPRIEPGALKADWRDDVFTMTVDTSAIQQQMAEALREADEKSAEPVVVEWLRNRGWLVEKPSSDGISRHAVDRFKVAWGRADEELDHGNRVRRGLEAARLVMFFEPLGLIDKTLDNIETLDADWTEPEVRELLVAIRAAITGGDGS